MGKRGQGLVEYLVLVALITAASIGVVSLVGKNIREQYANISAALRHGEKTELSVPGRRLIQERNLDDFLEGSDSSQGAGLED